MHKLSCMHYSRDSWKEKATSRADNAIVKIRNATEITSPSGLSNRPSSALRQQLHSPAMRLLSRLEYERLFGASWSTYFVRIP